MNTKYQSKHNYL